MADASATNAERTSIFLLLSVLTMAFELAVFAVVELIESGANVGEDARGFS